MRMLFAWDTGTHSASTPRVAQVSVAALCSSKSTQTLWRMGSSCGEVVVVVEEGEEAVEEEEKAGVAVVSMVTRVNDRVTVATRTQVALLVQQTLTRTRALCHRGRLS